MTSSGSPGLSGLRTRPTQRSRNSSGGRRHQVTSANSSRRQSSPSSWCLPDHIPATTACSAPGTWRQDGQHQDLQPPQSVLDISPHPCDYYLVLTGPAGQARVLPWVIEPVFLFERKPLLAALTAREVKIGIATSISKADWETARVFPPQQASPLQLSESQLAQLALFSSQTTQIH